MVVNVGWDLAQYYFTEVLNVPDYVLSGCGLVSNMLYQPKRADLDAYFDEIDVHTMQQGDVCIMEYGHICIFDNWNESVQCNYFFSQNPNPCQVMSVSENGMHAFRRKKETPPAPEPTPVITPNVERDEYKNQIEVKIDKLRVRSTPGLNGEVIGFANIGFYNYFETKADIDGYGWYRISDSNWIAYDDEWENVYPAKEKEYLKLEILDEKEGYVLVDLGKVWIKKD